MSFEIAIKYECDGLLRPKCHCSVGRNGYSAKPSGSGADADGAAADGGIQMHNVMLYITDADDENGRMDGLHFT